MGWWLLGEDTKLTRTSSLFLAKPQSTMKTNNQKGISEDGFDRVVKAAKKYEEDRSTSWSGVDQDLLISLSEYHFIAKPTEVSGDEWTLIIHVPSGFPGAPGFKIEHVNLNDLKEFCLNRANYNVHGYESAEEYWDFDGTIHQLHDMVREGDLMRPSHYFDKPQDANDICDLLLGDEVDF